MHHGDLPHRNPEQQGLELLPTERLWRSEQAVHALDDSGVGREHGGDVRGPLQVKHPGDVEQSEAGVVQTYTVQETGQDLLQLQPAREVGSWPGSNDFFLVWSKTWKCNFLHLEMTVMPAWRFSLVWRTLWATWAQQQEERERRSLVER